MRATTMKALKTLLRLQKEVVDKLLMAKSACMIEIEKLNKEKEITLERLEKERHFAGEVSSYQTFSAFTKKVYDKVEAVEIELEIQFAKASELEDKFIQAFKKQKGQETVLEKAEEDNRKSEDAIEKQMFDEVALRKHQKS